jgi:hypothetical protein
MGLDRVDIGGAAERGLPPMPPMRTIDSSILDIETPKEAMIGSTPIPRTVVTVPDLDDVRPESQVPVSDRVVRAAMPGAKIAYPDQHPANRDDLEQDASGALVIGKGQTLSRAPAILGDVREGYVDGPAGSKGTAKAPRPYVTGGNYRKTQAEANAKLAAAQNASVGALPTKTYEELVREEKAGTPRPSTPPAPAVAKDVEGIPLIEVIFQLPSIGAIASYYHRVEWQGRCLVLVVDNTQPAVQRFLPNPQRDSIGVIITGKDRKTMALRVTPIGLQFTMDNYDFTIMLAEPMTAPEPPDSLEG